MSIPCLWSLVTQALCCLAMQGKVGRQSMVQMSGDDRCGNGCSWCFHAVGYNIGWHHVVSSYKISLKSMMNKIK